MSQHEPKKLIELLSKNGLEKRELLAALEMLGLVKPVSKTVISCIKKHLEGPDSLTKEVAINVLRTLQESNPGYLIPAIFLRKLMEMSVKDESPTIRYQALFAFNDLKFREDTKLEKALTLFSVILFSKEVFDSLAHLFASLTHSSLFSKETNDRHL